MLERNDHPESPETIVVIDLTGDDEESNEEVDDIRPDWFEPHPVYLAIEDAFINSSLDEISTLSDPEQTSKFHFFK